MVFHANCTTLSRELNTTSGWIHAASDAVLKDVTDLNGRHITLMRVLQCEGTVTLSQVVRDTGVYGDDLRGLLSPLFSKGYIQRCLPFSEEKIELTDNGEQALGDLLSVVEETEKKVLADFSDKEIDQFKGFLDRIRANCTSITEGQDSDG